MLNRCLIYCHSLLIKGSDADLWQIEIDEIKMGGFKTENTKATVDSGTALIIGPNSDVREIAEEVGATKSLVGGNYIIDCEEIGNIPDLTFTIDGNEYTLPGSKLVIESAGVCLFAMESHGERKRKKGGKMTEEWKNYWVLGESFMSEYYTVFDVEEHRVGFAAY